jgi:tetratricopeptide (TPR) repeat protein
MPLSSISARWLSIGTLLLCLLGAASNASAQTEAEEQARAHFRIGRAHYDNGDFLRAAQEFEAAFSISQHSQLLYNIYLAYRDANVSRKAMEALKGYLEQVQDVPNRAQLAARLESLQQSLANEPEQPDPATTPDTTATAAAATTGTETSPPADTTAPVDTAAPSGGGKNILVQLIVMSAGGALILGSVVTGIITSGKESDLESECGPSKMCGSDNQTAKDLQSSGNTMALVTDILLFGGLAVAGTGVALFLLSGSGGSTETPTATASIACLPGACAGAVQVRF